MSLFQYVSSHAYYILTEEYKHAAEYISERAVRHVLHMLVREEKTDSKVV